MIPIDENSRALQTVHNMPEFVKLIIEATPVWTTDGAPVLQQLQKGANAKDKNNQPLFDAVEFRDGSVKPLIKRVEDTRKAVKAAPAALVKAIDGAFKAALLDNLRAYQRKLDAGIVRFREKHLPEDQKTITTDGGVSCTVRKLRRAALQGDDKRAAFEKLVKACISRAKNNEHVPLEFLKLDMRAIEAYMRSEGAKKIPGVTWEYYESVV